MMLCTCNLAGIMDPQPWDHRPRCPKYAPPPTPEELAQRHQGAMQQHRERYDAWVAGGKQGPPPPRPIGFPTPGWAPRTPPAA